MATSFSGGRSRREPPTMDKQLVNFITNQIRRKEKTITEFTAGK
jgi:hypothetical protein